jgi:hypothetical protein
MPRNDSVLEADESTLVTVGEGFVGVGGIKPKAIYTSASSLIVRGIALCT